MQDEEIISTKEEIKEGIRESFRELRASLKGEHKFLTEEEFWNEVKREVMK
jgi:hypothetical protein